MTSYTPQEQAYARLHEDYTNDLITRAEYEAGFARLNGPSRRRSRVATALLIILILVVALGAAAICVGQL